MEAKFKHFPDRFNTAQGVLYTNTCPFVEELVSKHLDSLVFLAFSCKLQALKSSSPSLGKDFRAWLKNTQ